MAPGHTLHCKAVVVGGDLINGWIAGAARAFGAGGWAAPVLVAPFAGSFVGVLIKRVPEGRRFAWGRSACDRCGHALAVRDLVPFASYAALRGRCRYCGGPIGFFPPLVELAALLLALWAVNAGARGAQLWASCLLGWTLLALAGIDIRCQRLPDFLTLPLILLGLSEAKLVEPWAFDARILGAIAGYAGFRVLALLYKRLRGREALGQGDAKLLAAGGAWIGAPDLPAALGTAAGVALLYALRRLRLDMQERIPFGPFLATGIWLLWLYG